MKSVLFRFSLLFVMVLMGAFSSASGQNQAEFPKGKITERVVCQPEGKYSYALFLPSNYAPDKRWPILYAFDPGARGRLPVELFQEAADKYGYIVVCSNDSRNGLGAELNSILQSLWQDTHLRFSIDDKRVYTTGFSGGARVATALGLFPNSGVAGVIVCGGGWPQSNKPSKPVPFVLFGLAGSEDFNYFELRQLKTDLDTIAVSNRFAVFEGGHMWAPKEFCTEALEWMEVQAMKAGRREKNEVLITELLTKWIEKAHKFEEAKQMYAAWSLYDSLANDFKGFKDMTEATQKAAQLKDSKEIKDFLKQEKDQEQKQQLRLREFFTLQAGLKNREAQPQALADLHNTLSSLKKKADEKNLSNDRLVARRVLGQCLVFELEEADRLRQQKNYAAAAVALLMAAEIRPESYWIQYNLACTYSISGEKKKAVEVLKKAVEKGFSDATILEKEKDLDAIRDNAEFQKLVESLKQSKTKAG